MFKEMRRLAPLMALVITGAVLAACATATPAPTPAPKEMPTLVTTTEAPTEAPTTEAATTEAPADLLAEIQERGTLVFSTDPQYPPQSAAVDGATRDANTKCTTDQHTASEFKGFDIDVAVAIAKGLNVEPCFVTPSWDLITAGGWAGRFDMSVGSMTVTPERMKVLYFSQPYYTTPAALFVAKDSALTKPEELSGKTVGSCSGCTYESYLNGALEIPGEKIDFVVKGATIKGYDTDTTALEDLLVGRLDGVLTAQPTGGQYIKDGKAIKQLGDPIFFEYLSAAFDRSSDKDPMSLVAKVTEIINGLHKDGTLTKLSNATYGTDLSAAAASFDGSVLNK